MSLTNSESIDIPHNLFLKGSTSYKPVYVNNLLLPDAMGSVHCLKDETKLNEQKQVSTLDSASTYYGA